MKQSHEGEKTVVPSVFLHKGWGTLIRKAAEEQNLSNSDFIRQLPEHGDIPLQATRECIYDFYTQYKNDSLFYDIAKHVTPLTFSLFSLTLWTSPNIETLLKNICEYSTFIGTPIRLSYHQNIQGDVELWILDNEPLNKENHLTFLGSSLFIATIIVLIKKICAEHNLSIDVQLMKKNFSDLILKNYTEKLNVSIKLEYPIRKICIEKKYLYLRLSNNDKDIYYSSLNLLREKVGLINKKDLILKIYNYLNTCGNLSEITGESLACSLNIHIRTLNRRLSEYGTSYRRVLEKFKLERALYLLEDSDISMTEIAYRLGFSDLSTFSRAFKRWTGLSPTKRML